MINHELGGSPQDEHLVQPKDAAVLVERMEGIAAATRRPINFFRIPVPKERADAAYYAPLEQWKRPTGTELYLGLLLLGLGLGGHFYYRPRERLLQRSGAKVRP